MQIFKTSCSLVNLSIILLLPSVSLAQGNSPSLTIRTTSSLPSTTIYANGNMQAKLIVSYKNIPNGYKVEKLSLKEAYTSNNLPSTWVKSHIDHGYDGDINVHRSATRNQINQNSNSQIFYLSTRDSNSDITVCAELVAANANGNRQTLSTCNGDTNNGLVHVAVISEINYGIEDLDHVTNREWYEDHSYAISQEKFTLRNNRQIRDVGGCDTSIINNGKRYLISSTNGPAHPYSGHHKYGAVYLFKPNRGVVTSNFPYSNNTKWLETVTLSFNTTNSLSFAVLHGQDNQKTYVNPLINWVIHCPIVTFRDNYGNEGILNISRHSSPDDKWGSVYYKFH